MHQLAVGAHLDWNQGGRLHWVFILTHWGYINNSAASYWPGWGSVAYPSPSVRASFIRQMQAFVDANPLIAAALYWDSQVAHCNYEINDSSSSLAALASMGHAPDMQGQSAGS